MLDTQNFLQNHIKNSKATKFLLQSAVYTSKGSTCKVLPFYDVWFKFYDRFCRPYPIVDFLRIFNNQNWKPPILLVPSLFSRMSSVFGRLQNPVLLVLSSKNGRFRRPFKASASWAGRLRRLWKDSRSDVFSLSQLGLRALFLSWSLRNLPKSVGGEWKTSPAKSTGFRIQLLSTENRRYQKHTPWVPDFSCFISRLSSLRKTIGKSVTDSGYAYVTQWFWFRTIEHQPHRK